MPLFSRSRSVSAADIERFLRAVDDPFNHPVGFHYDPMRVVAALIGLATLDKWQNHLRERNFAECEKLLYYPSSIDRFADALFATAEVWPEFCATRQRVDLACERLRALGCPRTAEKLSTWAAKYFGQ